MSFAAAESVGAIIAAAGTSQRMEGVDKIFAPLARQPLLAWTVECFQRSPLVQQVVLVVQELNLERARKLATELGWTKVTHICPGGARRQDSVWEGLKRLGECQWVVVHDGARPCLTPELIQQGLAEAQGTGAAVAAMPVTDTIKVVGLDGRIQGTPYRPSLWAVQTPQVFRRDLLLAAYARAQGEVTDDASLVEALGHTVMVFLGSYDNIKVTTPRDLALAEIILQRRHHGD